MDPWQRLTKSPDHIESKLTAEKSKVIFIKFYFFTIKMTKSKLDIIYPSPNHLREVKCSLGKVKRLECRRKRPVYANYYGKIHFSRFWWEKIFWDQFSLVRVLRQDTRKRLKLKVFLNELESLCHKIPFVLFKSSKLRLL